MYESLNNETFQAVKDLFAKRGFNATTAEIDAMEVCGNAFQIRVNQVTFRAIHENISGYHGRKFYVVYRLQGGGEDLIEWTRYQADALQTLVKMARNQRKCDNEIEAEIEAAFDAMTI